MPIDARWVGHSATMTRQQLVIDIAAETRKRDVDNKLSLKTYYRSADNLLRQANIYRNEKNILQLYIFLLRFSSLVSETLPDHRDYNTNCHAERTYFKQRLKDVLTELETIKPVAVKEVERINSQGRLLHQSSAPETDAYGRRNELALSKYPATRSFSIPPPRQETLAKHSLLGLPSQQVRKETSTAQLKVHYPRHIDTSVIEIPSLDQGWRTPIITVGTSASSNTLDPVDSLASSLSELLPKPVVKTTFTDSMPTYYNNLLRQPSPPPVIAPVQTLPAELEELNNALFQPQPSNVADPRPGPPVVSEDVSLHESSGPKNLHIAAKMMEEFMHMARKNTERNLETCGVLAGSLKNGTFFVTALIIPKQESTSDSCQTVNEEEIFESQDKLGLFQLGWIHTHPSQSCFMSSIDLHTHYSYQIMLPEAIAIVMAPTDSSRSHGIFRLADPGGVKVIQQCQRRGFHQHDSPEDGGPIYEHCAHVFMNERLRFDVIDLRVK